MAVANVLEKFGALDEEDETIDVTQAFEDAFDESLAVFVPVRKSGDSNIAYRIRNLDIPSGGQILCESMDVVFEAYGGTNYNIIETEGYRSDCRIHGGTWRNAKHVWYHKLGAGSAVVRSEFVDMKADNCISVFRFTSASGNLWQGVLATDCKYGFYFGSGKDTGYIANNVIRQCSFYGYTCTGILLAATKRGEDPQSQKGLLIAHCAFEDGYDDGSTPVYAIKANQGVGGLSVVGCWFERAAPNGHDIYLNDMGRHGRLENVRVAALTEIPPTAVVEQCIFNAPAVAQGKVGTGVVSSRLARIKVDGRCYLSVRDNMVALVQNGGLDSGDLDDDRWTHLLEWNGDSGCRAYVSNNRLFGANPDSYEVGLVNATSAPCGVYVSEWPW